MLLALNCTIVQGALSCRVEACRCCLTDIVLLENLVITWFADFGISQKDTIKYAVYCMYVGFLRGSGIPMCILHHAMAVISMLNMVEEIEASCKPADNRCCSVRSNTHISVCSIFKPKRSCAMSKVDMVVDV